MIINQREVAEETILAALTSVVEAPDGMRIREAWEPPGQWDHVWFAGRWYSPVATMPMEAADDGEILLYAVRIDRVLTDLSRRWVDRGEIVIAEGDKLEFEVNGVRRYSRALTPREEASLRRAGR